tara:strand:+ start:1109 stop:1690 length:582 start_codon:yes stop_codon:yes gene_type:complete
MIIGISGKARTGKDTCAKFIVMAAHQHKDECSRFYSYEFARPIKEACRIIFGWDDRHLYGDLKEVVDLRFGITPRRAMQTLGTEWGRDMINEEIWIKRANVEHNQKGNVVISDVRFKNEVKFIHENGGFIIDLHRKNVDRINGIENHGSETGVSEFLGPNDVYVDNDGSFEELQEKITSIFNQHHFMKRLFKE